MKFTKAKVIAVARSYGYAYVSAVVGLYAAGTHQPKVLLTMAASMVLTPIFRALTPGDQAFSIKTWHLIQTWRSRKVAASKV